MYVPIAVGMVRTAIPVPPYFAVLCLLYRPVTAPDRQTDARVDGDEDDDGQDVDGQSDPGDVGRQTPARLELSSTVAVRHHDHRYTGVVVAVGWLYRHYLYSRQRRHSIADPVQSNPIWH